MLGRRLPLRLRDKRGVVLLRHEHSWSRWLPGQVLGVQLLGRLLPLLHIHEGRLRGSDRSMSVQLARPRLAANAPAIVAVIGASAVLLIIGNLQRELVWLFGLCALSISMAAATSAGP